jgi:hypothetical protein
VIHPGPQPPQTELQLAIRKIYDRVGVTYFSAKRVDFIVRQTGDYIRIEQIDRGFRVQRFRIGQVPIERVASDAAGALEAAREMTQQR